ncbi:VOC family protein [Streptomyces sp. NPDC093510]|uniref:VOC family protein n=1 Tax=Streptomyces sp. NPDC093510 TaxID=3155199 RepID=UPI00341E684E
MSLQMNTVMLGVEDMNRAKKFYVDGLGCTLDQDLPGFVRLRLGPDAPMLALYEWDAAAKDAGVPAEGSGFRGVSLHFTPDSRDEVDETVQAARAAGGTVVKEPAAAQWGGYYGYFSDPDGHLWKVATAT